MGAGARWMMAAWLASCGAGCFNPEAPDGDAGAPEPAPFQVVFEGLDSALIAVAGSAADDVWAVGSDAGDGEGALALHYDGDDWRRVPTGVEADLWWVHVFARDEVWVGGSQGSLLRHDGSAFAPIDTPASATVWGIWGESPDDVWIVGGDVDVSPGFVWHYDGAALVDRTDELPPDVRETVLFKVWGRSGRDVWMVGMDGVAIHWDGDRFARADSGTDRRLFTVHGPPAGEPAFVAVGGFGDGVIVEHDGTQWHNTTPDPAPVQLFGVFMDRANHGYAVGYEVGVLEYADSAWNMLDIGYEAFEQLHAVWVDPQGGVWAVGGDVLSPFPNAGVLLHRGDGERISDAITD